MNKRWRFLIIPVLIVAAVLRWTGIDWDDYQHYHPDERYITWVAASMAWPHDLRGALDPQRSSFNPYYWSPDAESEGITVLQDQPRDFAYGHFPLYLGVAATRLLTWVGPVLRPLLPADWVLTRDILNGAGHIPFTHLTIVGRALTGLVDVGCVWLVFRFGRKIHDQRVGLLAAAFLALNVLHIQLAHFFAFDPYMTFFTVAALLNMVAALQTQKHSRLLLAAICIGLAVGSKFSAIMLVIPFSLTILWSCQRWRALLQRFVLLGFVSAATFALTNPFALLDFSCDAITPGIRFETFEIPAINWGSCFFYNIGKQAAMVNGVADFGFTRQYSGTRDFLYFAEMQGRWGMGWVLGVAVLGGLIWMIGRNLRDLNRHRVPLIRLSRRPELLVLVWVLPFIFSTGRFYVKFMRYMQPVIPFLMVFAAAWILSWKRQNVRRVVSFLVLFGTGLYALAFVNIYTDPHPWVQASAWIYDHVPPQSVVATELWGDRLPTGLERDGEWDSAATMQYVQPELTWLSFPDEEDDLEKLVQNVGVLVSADFLVIDSNRIYGVLPRLPDRYPLSNAIYARLFAGELGYELVYTVNRAPHLGRTYLQPDFFDWPGLTPPQGVSDYLAGRINGGRVDESFTLYDQSLVMVFENVGRFSAETIQQQLTSR